MAYLGRGIENLSDRVVLDSLTASATASYTLQLNSVNFVPSSAESLTVSLNGVIQAPISSYTVSGSTLTFASALTSSDSIDFIIAERGITLQTPSAGSVGTSQLANGAVTLAKTDGNFGKVLQVVNTEFTGTESTSVLASGGNFADSSLTATLTPSSTSSKIFVTCTVNRGSTNNADASHVGRLVHVISATTTPFFVGASAGSRTLVSFSRGNESAGFDTLLTNTVHTIFSPNTTSAVTVKYQFAARGTGAGTVYINQTAQDTDSVQYQRTASSITLMEIAG